MNLKLPKDKNGEAVQVLNPSNGNNYEVAITDSSATNTNAIQEKVIGIYVPSASYIKLGDENVTVSNTDYDVYIPAGGYREYEVEGQDYVAIIKATGEADATAFINGLN